MKIRDKFVSTYMYREALKKQFGLRVSLFSFNMYKIPFLIRSFVSFFHNCTDVLNENKVLMIIKV